MWEKWVYGLQVVARPAQVLLSRPGGCLQSIVTGNAFRRPARAATLDLEWQRCWRATLELASSGEPSRACMLLQQRRAEGLDTGKSQACIHLQRPAVPGRRRFSSMRAAGRGHGRRHGQGSRAAEQQNSSRAARSPAMARLRTSGEHPEHDPAPKAPQTCSQTCVICRRDAMACCETRSVWNSARRRGANLPRPWLCPAVHPVAVVGAADATRGTCRRVAVAKSCAGTGAQ